MLGTATNARQRSVEQGKEEWTEPPLVQICSACLAEPVGRFLAAEFRLQLISTLQRFPCVDLSESVPFSLKYQENDWRSQNGYSKQTILSQSMAIKEKESAVKSTLWKLEVYRENMAARDV